MAPGAAGTGVSKISESICGFAFAAEPQKKPSAGDVRLGSRREHGECVLTKDDVNHLSNSAGAFFEIVRRGTVIPPRQRGLCSGGDPATGVRLGARLVTNEMQLVPARRDLSGPRVWPRCRIEGVPSTALLRPTRVHWHGKITPEPYARDQHRSCATGRRMRPRTWEVKLQLHVVWGSP